MVHSPKVLVLIGVLAFIASLAWMYRLDRGAIDDTVGAPSDRSATETQLVPKNAETRKTVADSADSNAPTEVASRSDSSARRPSARPERGAPVSAFPDSAAPDSRPREEEQPVEEEPLSGDLSISGRVITTDGTPVPGIILVAKGQVTG